MTRRPPISIAYEFAPISIARVKFVKLISRIRSEDAGRDADGKGNSRGDERNRRF
jgi:hypothetical protein